MPHARCSHSSTVRCEWSHPPFSDSGFTHHARWACRCARPRGNQRRRMAFPILFDDCSQRADASTVRGEPVEPRALGAAGNPARAERRSRVQARRGHRQCGATGRPRSAAVEQGARRGWPEPVLPDSREGCRARACGSTGSPRTVDQQHRRIYPHAARLPFKQWNSFGRHPTFAMNPPNRGPSPVRGEPVAPRPGMACLRPRLLRWRPGTESACTLPPVRLPKETSCPTRFSRPAPPALALLPPITAATAAARPRACAASC